MEPEKRAERITTYINPETGEVAEKRSFVDMLYSEDAGYIAWSRNNCIKTYTEMQLPTNFTWAERGRIEELKKYIMKGNQFLVYRSHNTIKPLSVDRLSDILELSNRGVKDFMKKLKTFGVIKEVYFNGQTYYSFNPMYGLMHKRITLTLFLIFQNELSEVLPKWVINKFVEQAPNIKQNVKVLR